MEDESPYQQAFGRFDPNQALPDPSGHDFVGQANEVTYNKKLNCILIYGVTPDGNTFTLQVHNFYHYFYMEIPLGFEDEPVDQVHRKLHHNIVRVERVRRMNCYGVDQPNKEHYKCYLNKPKNLKFVFKDWEKQQRFRDTRFYEHSKVSPVIRFMVDRSLMGCGLFRLRAGSYSTADRISSRQWDLACDVGSFEASEDGGGSTLAPMHCLYYDIEVKPKADGSFPTPDECEVITISAVMRDWTTQKTLWKAIVHTGEIDGSHFPDTECIEMEDEAGLLLAFREVILASDPDVLSGWNTEGFDMPFLYKRAKHIGVNAFLQIGCLLGTPIHAWDSTFCSAAHGKREFLQFDLLGRMSVDALVVFKRNVKNLRSYTLNSVAQSVLKKTKEDVHHSQIGRLYEGTVLERTRLASYCLKDSDLTWQLLEKKDYPQQYVQTARFIGIPLPLLLTRGEQVKVAIKLMRYCRDRGLIIPFQESKDKWTPFEDNETNLNDKVEERMAQRITQFFNSTSGKKAAAPEVTTESGRRIKYAGALVLKPKVGLHDDGPCYCLDFSSLYPSIMIAWNLCFSTLITNADIRRHPEWKQDVHYRCFHSGYMFLTPLVVKGILPTLAEQGLLFRGEKKKLMAAAAKRGDAFEESVYNGQQNAIKVFCNSIYGFCGAEERGMLPCVPVAFTITDQGQVVLGWTIAYVTEHFGDDVIYGDTDSIMPKAKGMTVQQAWDRMFEVADAVNKDLFNQWKPMKLAPEKVMFPSLYLAPKRYITGYFGKRPPDDVQQPRPDYIMYKGVEMVRRDNAAFVPSAFKACMEKLYFDRDTPGAIQVIKKLVEDIRLDRLPIDAYILSKSLRGDYTNEQPHAVLAERIEQRSPGEGPAIGSRVPYVIVNNGEKKNAHRAEDPLYALEHKVPIDREYYIEKQIKGPLERILPHFGINMVDLLASNKIKQSTMSGGALSKFFKVTIPCWGCKKSVPSGGPHKRLCPDCYGSGEVLKSYRLQYYQGYQDAIEEVNKAMERCQTCQGPDGDPEMCYAKDCKDFYRRKVSQQRLAEVEKELN